MSNSAFTPAVLTIPAAATTATGELNVISNPSAASLSTTGWTGVTAVGTNSPLNPTVTTAFSIANTAGAESSTSGGYASFTMPSGLQNKKLKVEFYFTTPATDVYKVSVYKSGSRVTLTTDSSGSTTLPASTTGKFVAYFDTDTTANWTVNITRTSGSTGPIYVTNVIVGPGIQPQGAVVGEWVSYTPTGSVTTNTTYSGKYRRVGSSLEGHVLLSFSGTNTQGEVNFTAAQLLNGLNLTIDTAAIAHSGGLSTSVGTWSGLDSGVNPRFSGIFTLSGTSFILAYPTGSSSAAAVNTTLNNPFTIASGDNLHIWFSVPISEWAGSGTVQLAQNDVEWASNSSTTDAADTTSFAYGPAGSTGVLQTTALTAQRLKRVRFQTPIQMSDVLTIEVQTSTSPNSWIPLTSSPYSLNYTEQNTASYGLGIRQVSGSSTDVDIAFGRYIYANGTTFAAVGVEWNNAGAVGLRAWRVRKSSAGAAVGFGIVSSSSAGLLPASNANLDDATATRLGLKQYLHGTTYNGGNAPTVTGGANITTLGTVRRAVFIPYQMQDGTWRVRFSIRIDGTTSVSAPGHQFSVAGITAKNNTNWNQAIVGYSDIANQTGSAVVSNSGTIDMGHGSSVTPTVYGFSGDVELESKPTWAY